MFLLTYIITFEPETPVSSKKFSKILPPDGWHPGPGKVGQGGLKVFHLLRHSQKPAPPKEKKFFRLRTRRLTRLLTLRPGP